MKTLINNYINGNLTTAKAQARRFSSLAIVAALREDYDYPASTAILVASWLKGVAGVTFQQVADAEAHDRDIARRSA